MELSDEEYYRALKAQDARFDGRFYICVRSTGIYCRPVCPARTTKFENCRFVRSAAEAEDAGYRPCLRCRPETAPGSPARLGTGATVRRALRLISESATEGRSIEDLAARLGIGTRQLRRLFNEHLGATPKSIMQTERFGIARQLLLETDLRISDIALASGFQSIRRFNDATRKAFGVTPSEFRRLRPRTPATDVGLKLRLGYRPPYAWDELLRFLSARAIPGVERVTHGGFQRTVSIDGVAGLLFVRAEAVKNQLIAEFTLDKPAVLPGALQRVRDMFDLDAGPEDVAEHLTADQMLEPLVRARPGLRIPGCWDPFELAARAVVGQQTSIKAASTMLGRLARAFGAKLDIDTGRGALEPTPPRILFPTAANLASKDLRKIGLTGARAKTLSSLAEAFALDPEFIHPSMEASETRRRLESIHGVGPWTSEYISLRALHNPDAFPAADLGLLKASGASTATALESHARAWRPWRGYAALYLWSSLS